MKASMEGPLLQMKREADKLKTSSLKTVRALNAIVKAQRVELDVMRGLIGDLQSHSDAPVIGRTSAPAPVAVATASVLAVTAGGGVQCSEVLAMQTDTCAADVTKHLKDLDGIRLDCFLDVFGIFYRCDAPVATGKEHAERRATG